MTLDTSKYEAPGSKVIPQARKLSVYFITGVATLGGLLFGYDTGVISGAQLFLVQTFSLNEQEQSFAVSCVLIGAVIGALIGGKVNDRFGRKKTMLALAVIFTIGALATAIAPNFAFFVVFRIVVGLGIGAAASVVPVYISEIAPTRVRGRLVTFNQLAITIGIAVSYWVDLFFSHMGGGWGPMFATAAIPSVLLFLGMLNSPESPRWLAGKGRWEEARDVLNRIQGAEPDGEIAEIRAALIQDGKQGTLRDLWRPGLRMALIVGVGLAIFQQFVGINTVIYYAPTIFQSAGIRSADAAIWSTSLVGVMNVLATVVATFLVDRLGRRVLLLGGTIGMVISLIMLGIFFAWGTNGGMVLFGLMLYIVSFALSMGPVFWLMSAELFPNRLRGIGASVCSFANWVSNLIVSLTFLSFVSLLGQSGAFWIYAGVGVLAFVFCLRLVPETKNKSLEEIEEHWLHSRVPDSTKPAA